MSESNRDEAPSGASFLIPPSMADARSEPFEALDISAIESAYTEAEIGSDVRYFPAVDSTNRIARELAPSEWRNGTVILTDFQTAGRGRQNRGWQAPDKSSLLLSILLVPIPSLPVQTMVMPAALAVQSTIRLTTGIEAELKWPNDVVYCGRKLCGILAELIGPPGDRRVVVGIGLNVNNGNEPQSFPSTATTLQAMAGHQISRQATALALFEQLNLWYGILTEDLRTVFRSWSSSLHIAGKDVAVHDHSGVWMGTVVDVEPDGALRVRDIRGVTVSVCAADVSIRKPGENPAP